MYDQVKEIPILSIWNLLNNVIYQKKCLRSELIIVMFGPKSRISSLKHWIKGGDLKIKA